MNCQAIKIINRINGIDCFATSLYLSEISQEMNPKIPMNKEAYSAVCANLADFSASCKNWIFPESAARKDLCLNCLELNSH
jgi:hypothetical protein